MTLHVNPTYSVTDERTVCDNELPVLWNGVEFTAAGTRTATLSTVNDCDSVVTMTLHVNPTYNVTDERTVCDNELPVLWNGVEFTAAGTRTTTLSTINDCDSVVTMTLHVNPTYNVTDERTVCDNELPFFWNGVEFTAAGIRTATLSTVNDCDSVVTMTLHVNPTYSVTDERTVCDNELPVLWNGVEFTAAGIRTATLSTINDCDSVVTMTLHVNPTYNVTDERTVCDNELPVFWNGVEFTAAGTQIATLQTVTDCDSVVAMTLNVNPTYNVTDERTICAGELPYTWNGVVFTQAGTQTVTLQTVNDCDSVVAMTLNVNPIHNVSDERTICAGELPYTWNNVVFTQAGTQTVTLQTVTDCDSVVAMTLNVNPTYNVTDERTICAGELPYTWNGVVFTQAGTQTVTMQTVNDCDSVVVMTLNVNPIHDVSDERTICAGELPYTWNGVVFTQAGTQTVTLQTVNDCDSVVAMTLNVNPIHNVSDERTICAGELPYTWNGVVFTQAGTQTVTLQTVNDCDSVVTMTLYVNPTYNVTDELTVCDNELPVLWNGVEFTAAGTQIATLQTVNDCDSVVTMTLYVNPAYNVIEEITICENELPYTYGDTVFDVGTPELSVCSFQFSTSNGCDSIVTLHLTVIDLPELNMIQGEPVICRNQYSTYSYDITNSDYNYYWYLNSQFLGGNVPSVVLYEENSGTHTLMLQVEDVLNGCYADTSMSILVQNAFAPDTTVIIRKNNTNILICRGVSSEYGTVHYRWGYTNLSTHDETIMEGDYNYCMFDIGIDLESYLYWVETYIQYADGVGCANRTYYGHSIYTDIDDYEHNTINARVVNDQLFLHVNAAAPDRIDVILYGINGQLLLTQHFGSTDQVNDILPFQYSNGLYLLIVRVGNQVYPVKLLKY